jgi:hypothetical protein
MLVGMLVPWGIAEAAFGMLEGQFLSRMTQVGLCSAQPGSRQMSLGLVKTLR